MSPSPTRPASRSFSLFWAGQAASNLGDAFAFVAMPLLVFELTGSVVDMGRVTAISLAGQVLTALVSGAIVDRVRRRYLMIGCDFVRMLSYAALAALAAAGACTLPVVYAVSALTAVASNLFFVGHIAAVANLVEPDAVAPANARLQASQALTYVVGSAIAGFVCNRLGPAAAIGVDSVSFIASAATLWRIRFRHEQIAHAERGGILSDLWSGLVFLARHRVLRALALFQTGIALLGSIGLGAAVIDLIVYRLKNDLHQSAAVVGFTLACSALGAVFGAVGAAKLRRRLRLGAIAVLGTGVQAAGLVGAGLGTGVVWVASGGLLWAFGLTCRSVGAISLRQTLTPDRLLGRVVAAGWVLIFSGSAAGALLVTHTAAAMGAGPASAWLGAALGVITVMAALSPLVRAAEVSPDTFGASGPPAHCAPGDGEGGGGRASRSH